MSRYSDQNNGSILRRVGRWEQEEPYIAIELRSVPIANFKRGVGRRMRSSTKESPAATNILDGSCARFLQQGWPRRMNAMHHLFAALSRYV